jgi:putative SOS response-associated peptidase YedK
MELSPELKPIIDRANHSQLKMTLTAKLGKPLKTEGEVRPTDIAPVIAPDRKSMTPTVFPMVWGFTNPYKSGSPLVNARIETASQKPFWKESWTRRRCVIPASYYFEWEHCTASDGKKKTAQKYMIQPKDSAVTFLAGLYGFEERNGITVPVFTILTREPGEGM